MNIILYLVVSAAFIYVSYTVKKKGSISKLGGMHSKSPRYTAWIWSVLYGSRHSVREIDEGDIIFVAMKHIFRVFILIPVLFLGPLFFLGVFLDHLTFYVTFPRIRRNYDAMKEYAPLTSSFGDPIVSVGDESRY
jgi:hypothetical protein